MSTPNREDVLADLRLAVDALSVARGHLDDAGAGGGKVPRSIHDLQIRTAALVADLSLLHSRIAAGEPVDTELPVVLKCVCYGPFPSCDADCSFRRLPALTLVPDLKDVEQEATR